MTIKKMKIYLATDIDKEADWLTDMSNKGFHFFHFSQTILFFNSIFIKTKSIHLNKFVSLLSVSKKTH